MSDPTRSAVQASAGLWDWLDRHQVSVALSTYQSQRLFLLGRKAPAAEGGSRLALHERFFDKPMGLFWTPDAITLACRYQIWRLPNRLSPGAHHEGGDRLYAPSQSWVTGDVSAHELVVDDEGRVLFVNTAFSCLATPDPDYRFAPVWQPPFIRRLAAEDRCHLNGLALQDGKATWMTACARSDSAGGWRSQRQDGGVVLHLPSDSVAAHGLSMPHSPRWHQNRLWLLNSGCGELGYLDSERFVGIAFCPGFARGLAFAGDYALITLSQLRPGSASGLALESILRDRGVAAVCGLWIIHLPTGRMAESLVLPAPMTELFDLALLPGVRQPRAIGLQGDAMERVVRLPGHDGLLTIRPSVGAAPTPHARSNGARASDGAEPEYQRVFNLLPEHLGPYLALLHPTPATWWDAGAPRGDLHGVAAVVNGTLVGLAVAERHQGSTSGERLLSWFVQASWRGRGVGRALLRHLGHDGTSGALTGRLR